MLESMLAQLHERATPQQHTLRTKRGEFTGCESIEGGSEAWIWTRWAQRITLWAELDDVAQSPIGFVLGFGETRCFPACDFVWRLNLVDRFDVRYGTSQVVQLCWQVTTSVRAASIYTLVSKQTTWICIPFFIVTNPQKSATSATLSSSDGTLPPCISHLSIHCATRTIGKLRSVEQCSNRRYDYQPVLTSQRTIQNPCS